MCCKFTYTLESIKVLGMAVITATGNGWKAVRLFGIFNEAQPKRGFYAVFCLRK